MKPLSKTKALVTVFCWCLVVLAILFGYAYYTMEPTWVHQIASTDCIVVKNITAELYPGLERLDPANPDFGKTKTITGYQMKEIIHAMSSLSLVGTDGVRQALPMCEWQLQFYQGTKLLDNVSFSAEYVRYGQDLYVDHTGTLTELFDQLTGAAIGPTGGIKKVSTLEELFDWEH